jgi:hypothetical protein
MHEGKIKRTSLIKRSRRSRDEMQAVLDWILYILSEEDRQVTIRHLFYRLVGNDVIPKTEAAYKILCSHLSKWRRSGAIEWSAFADGTRWRIKTETFDSMKDALANTAETYRRNMWGSQKAYVEIWTEKDACASVIAQAADPFGVPVFVARGFASLSSLYDAANTFREATEAGKRPIIYHFGDYDPSGVAAGDSIMRTLRDDFKVNVQFVRAAVTKEQIKKFKLPTRPTKFSNHSKNWKGGDSVELDTIPSADIATLVESCITRHIDQREWEFLKIVEAQEQKTLRMLRPLAGSMLENVKEKAARGE